ncbi:MAG: type II secretion system F family protein [Lachnospiraceae bacterium]|nr:type II secretion system F family protein [Lachnospiraceae bacterium]
MKAFYFIAERILKIFTPKGTETVREEQMLMHPGESAAKLTHEYYVKKIGSVLFLVFGGLLISMIILIYDINQTEEITGGQIERNAYGEGDKTVTLDLYKEGELYEREKEIVIEERRYTENELGPIFEEVIKELETKILGENSSPDHIDHDLNLVKSSGLYPIDIEWMIGDYDALDSSGHIQDGFHDSSGKIVPLTAILSYGAAEESHVFSVRVFPRYRKENDRLNYEIDRSISEYAEETRTLGTQVLPDEIDGYRFTYERSLSHTWLYIIAISLLSAFILYMGKDRDLKAEVVKREREMLLDYPEIVSKLTLLIGAGLTLRAAFEKVAIDYKNRTFGRRSFALEEMLITVNRMRSGVSEYEAYLDFGKRCAVRRYTKLGALFSQNIKKGSTGLLPELEREVHDAFEERKANARKQGEEAGTKLLLPMALMLSVVMIIVIVPAFMAFSL